MSNQYQFTDDREIYQKKYSGISDLDAGHLGEDIELFGDSISEVIKDMVQNGSRSNKMSAAQDLRLLLSCDDAELDRATWALISFDPTIDIEELEPGWGFYPSLRAFWADVLRYIEADLAKPDTAP